MLIKLLIFVFKNAVILMSVNASKQLNFKVLSKLATCYHFLTSGLLFIRLIFEDNENALFSVTLFKKVVDEFKHHAREKRRV